MWYELLLHKYFAWMRSSVHTLTPHTKNWRVKYSQYEIKYMYKHSKNLTPAKIPAIQIVLLYRVPRAPQHMIICSHTYKVQQTSLVPRPILSPARIAYSIRTGRLGLAQCLHISCSAGMQALSGFGR